MARRKHSALRKLLAVSLPRHGANACGKFVLKLSSWSKRESSELPNAATKQTRPPPAARFASPSHIARRSSIASINGTFSAEQAPCLGCYTWFTYSSGPTALREYRAAITRESLFQLQRAPNRAAQRELAPILAGFELKSAISAPPHSARDSCAHATLALGARRNERAGADAEYDKIAFRKPSLDNAIRDSRIASSSESEFRLCEACVLRGDDGQQSRTAEALR